MPRGVYQRVKPIVAPPKTVEVPAPAYDLVMLVRHIHSGSFAGLWELRVANPDGTTKIIVDASTRQSVINKASELIARTV